MDLLEREAPLHELHTALDEAAAGAGRIAFVSGEAGIGKTSLVDRFEADVRAERPDVRTLRGACDSLFTPRPLGPVLDIARQAERLRAAIELGDVEAEAVFETFHAELERGRPATLVVFEDVHWADEATLDLLKLLGRRIRRMPVLLVATFRDDELGRDHPLWHLLGELPRDAVHRIPLAPLSAAAVEALAGESRRSGKAVWALTDGNPFFVTEILASDADDVPPSVREAVLARALRLGPAEREILDVVAVVPDRIERSLLADVAAPEPDAVEACIAAGLLESAPSYLAFRHELARQVWERTLEEARARTLHARVLDALSRQDADGVSHARLVHHARLADDADNVLRLAPAAAREAARLGAHREAATLYSIAETYAGSLPAAERADLLDALSYECYLTARMSDAADALERALAIWRELGDRRREGASLCALSRIAWYRGDVDEVRRHAIAAVDVLEDVGAGPDLAMAYGTLAQLHLGLEEAEDAIAWGSRAIAMAREIDDERTLLHALNTVGTTMLLSGDDDGRALLEESLELARRHGLQDDVGRACINLGCATAAHYDFDAAVRAFDEAIAYCEQRDMASYELCAVGERALVRLRQGDWAGAAEDAARVIRHPRTPPVDRIPALAVIGRLRARRGDPGSADVLDEARDLAVPTGELQRIAPTAAARAEAAWLEARPGDAAAEAAAALDLAVARRNTWAIGELAYWAWRAGGPDSPPDGAAEPYALQMRGDWRTAADAWEEIDCPYERALALAESGEPAVMRDALAILHDLGARVTADWLAGELRALGEESVPRGPRRTTRENPARLTQRQMDVLTLVASGLTNAEIAERLFVSPRTVENHVSAVLRKLDVGSRTEAAAAARAMGAID